MNVKRNGRTSKLRVHRLNSPRRLRGPSCRDIAPGWRRSFADGALNPLRRTKRTSKPCRLRRLRNDRKGPWSVFFHTASSPPPASLPDRPCRRRRPPPEQVRRSVSITRPPCVRACAFSSSRAPCAGGSRDSARRMRLPRLCSGRIGLSRICVPYRGRPRIDFARAQEVFPRILDKGPFPCAWPSGACGVRVHKRVLLPDPYGSWFPPFVVFRRTAASRRDVFRTHPRHSIFPQTRCSPHS